MEGQGLQGTCLPWLRRNLRGSIRFVANPSLIPFISLALGRLRGLPSALGQRFLQFCHSKCFLRLAVVLVWVLLMGSNPVFASGSTDTGVAGRLTTLEKSLFSVSYVQDPPETRVSRLENVVYGEMKTSTPIEQRISALEQTITAAPQPLPDSVFDESVQSSAIPPAQASAPDTAVSPPGEDYYPAVTQMETQVLGQRYPQEDLSVRVTRLEQKVFGQTNPSAPLIERVDRLAARVKPQMPIARSPYAQDDTLSQDDNTAASATPAPDWMRTGPTGASSPANGQTAESTSAQAPPQDFYTSLSATENKLLHTTYASEPAESRLARLETQVFHQPADNSIPPQERLNRVIAVADGGGNHVETVGMSRVKRYLPLVLMLLPLLL
jgi:hypothetical protein